MFTYYVHRGLMVKPTWKMTFADNPRKKLLQAIKKPKTIKIKTAKLKTKSNNDE